MTRKHTLGKELMNSKKEIKKITEQIVKRYKPEKVILYGSFAYGRPRKEGKK